MQHEWAENPEDVLWRRSKAGLVATASDQDALAKLMKRPASAG